MEIECALCNSLFNSFRLLKVHMDFYHKSIDKYSCSSPGCFRSYGLFNSYRRHYLACHNSRQDHSAIAPIDQISNSAISQYQNINPTNSNEEHSLTFTHRLNTDDDYNNSNAPSTFNAQEFHKTLAKLGSKLYANPQVPLNIVDDVFGAFSELFNHIPDLPLEQSENIKNIFNSFNSLHMRLKYYEEVGTYIKPQNYVVGTRYDFVTRNGRRVYERVECEAHFIQLRDVLKQFFSLRNILEETLQYVRMLMDFASDVIQHFVQGSFWQSRRQLHGNKLVLPLFLQVDDFEPLNSLGSHSSIHKMGAAYISVPCLPPKYVSQLSNIFLALIYHTSDRVQFGNLIIFKPLIDELNYLARNGIIFDLPHFKGTIYFELGLLLGDNLGLHSITGFNESFSSNFPCRMCKINKRDMTQQFYQDDCLLRTADNYKLDLNLNDPSLTGIKEECIWLKVDNFDLFSQMGYDIMHDWHEGVIKYIMSSLLVALMDECKFFTITHVNNKISAFNFGPDKPDAPVTLSMEHLRKGTIRLAASEMMSFCRYFGIMFGDLVPRDQKYWSIYTQLMQVLDIVMSESFFNEKIHYFEYMIATLCEMYSTLFNKNITPKFHNLMHYPSAVLRFGPLAFLSSMRFEAKHRPNKLASKSSNNRRNMTLTTARRHQLKLNDTFLRDNISSEILYGVQSNVRDTEGHILAQEFGWSDINKIKKVSWLKASSTHYKESSIIVNKIESDNVHFARINTIYVYDCEQLAFKAQQLETIRFDDHYYAYQVNVPHYDLEIIYIKYKDLQHRSLCNFCVIGYDNPPENYVILRKPL